MNKMYNFFCSYNTVKSAYRGEWEASNYQLMQEKE